MFYFYLSHIILLLSLCRVWKSKKTHKQLKEAQKESYEERKKELNMAVVLLWVVILFITCQSIKIIPDIYEALYCTTKEVQFFTFISNLHFTIKHFKLFKFVISIINRNLDRHNDAFKHLQGFCWKRIWCCYASYQHGSLYFHLI